MISKLLIANRGEIACRVIKTAKKLNISTVAIYSSIDKNALHVEMADEAYCVGEPPPSQSYLNQKEIINIALKTGVEAIHPGYGFLAENAGFAERCKKNNILFVGPPPSAITVMGDKSEAKKWMKKAGVPVIPGYEGENQDLSTFRQVIEKIGLPVLLKASAGGGGKGMRLIHQIEELNAAFQSAKRESLSSFDNDTLFIEKYIEPARHVEVQIFLDSKGNGVYLFDRDCSMQRRHQKIIEEAKAPGLKEKTRQKMGETAVSAAQSINYLGAGTIEFLVDANENYYFMEMNTRLQVEHPVTEMITGLDLVEWQLHLASGEDLPLTQNQLTCRGHAFEARICAENPENNFSPSIGKLVHCVLPEANKHVRIDSGVVQGDTISPYYDPMIAKLIVWDETREKALNRLSFALEKTYILGVDTNVEFLYQLSKTKAFKAATLSTNFIEKHQTDEHFKPNEIPKELLIIAALADIHWQQTEANDIAKNSEDRFSPWFIRDHWRLMEPSEYCLTLWFNEAPLTIKINQNDYAIEWQNLYELTAIINKKTFNVAVIKHNDEIHIFHEGQHYILNLENPQKAISQEAGSENRFASPMPGTIVEVLIKPGQSVTKGERLIVLEAMKMEHTIKAPSDGTIKSVFYKTGDLINEGVDLLEFEV